MYIKTSLCFILLFYIGCSNSLIFSSMAKIRQTLTLVRSSNTTAMVARYVKQLRNKLEYIKVLTGKSLEIRMMLQHPKFHLEKPISAVKYVLAASGALTKSPKLISSSSISRAVSLYLSKLPLGTSDILGISQGILLGQETHRMPTKDVVNGWYGGRKARALSLRERVDMARSLPKMYMFARFNNYVAANRSLEWLIAAKELLRTRQEAVSLYQPFIDVLTSLQCQCSAFSRKLFGELQQYQSNLRIPDNCSVIAPERCVAFDMARYKVFSYDEYEALCRGEYVPPDADIPMLTPKRLLKCRYEDNNDPRLLLAPLKTEELNKGYSYVAIIHALITDTESAFLQSKSVNHLKFITGSKYGNTLASQMRYMQMHEFPDNLYRKQLATLRGRLSAFSKLNIQGFQKLQVFQYGSAGIRNPHLDAFASFKFNESLPNDVNNKLFTSIIYLNDVTQGGDDVFPLLGISVKPERNSALVFYNLYRNGYGNTLAMHGSCPILYGEKWIAYQSVDTYGQEFSHPCSLDRME